ncbi:TIGR04561 family membrane protein [Spiroplasma apis]|uniref:Uncharacterized protein n=1 Tax=Spiroplasma apis B31 TaxID=1276258 RepID=V5RHN1_SPIAP|nr:TIGR04561 family membrane protein [Spiroplasma apis]AHB36187.1 hypothetical protein SAPIS_v1c03410 [Spiroplasma apis B31]
MWLASSTVFKVLNFEVQLWVILLIFAIIGLTSLILYIFVLLKKNRKYLYEKTEVTAKDFKRLEKFEQLRNDFEIELAKIKKYMKSQK